MKTVKLAKQAVFPIGLGTWKMGEERAPRKQEIAALRAGIEAGAEVIDTAEMYGNGLSEELVGEAITFYDREKLFLISKVLPSNASKKQLAKSLDASLKRLKTDYLDQYLLHWPGQIPFQETIEALEEQRQKGKIKSWGVSNLDTDELKEILRLENGDHCATNQVCYNLGDRGIEFDLIPLMRQQQMPLIAYCPLAMGDSQGFHFTKEKSLIELSEKHDCDIFQLLLAWCIRDGQTIAIPKAGKSEHVLSNLKAAEIQLSEEDLIQLNQVYPEPTRKMPLTIW